jgi:hypothetical protein
MKKKILLTLLCLYSLTSVSQDKINVAVGATSTSIETYRYSLNEYYLDKAYRLGPSSLKTIKEGINTAIKWKDLNNSHLLTFSKEICRFKVMDKESYKFHGYVDGFTIELVMNFNGFSDGTFKIEIKQYDYFGSFIIIEDNDMLNGFKKLLNGKSANANSGIDDIFKK